MASRGVWDELLASSVAGIVRGAPLASAAAECIIERAATNALIGNADEVARQMVERFHPQDRLMLWFDFFNHDSERVVQNMERFMDRVAPRVKQLIG